MAISYSYPMGTPKLTDTVLGVQYEEMRDPAVKNFSISDIAALAVEEIGNVTQGPAGPQGPTGAQGVQGNPGTPGAVGPAGLEWQGAWEFDSTYTADDAVSFAGASYFCILNVDTNSNPPPDEDTTHWALLAAQGAPGIQGVQGPTGAQGPAGTISYTEESLNSNSLAIAGNPATPTSKITKTFTRAYVTSAINNYLGLSNIGKVRGDFFVVQNKSTTLDLVIIPLDYARFLQPNGFASQVNFTLKPNTYARFTLTETTSGSDKVFMVEVIKPLGAAPTLQQVTDEGADAYGNNINLKYSSISDSLIQLNVDDFFEPCIKVVNEGAGSNGHSTILGSSTIEFEGNGDYNTIVQAGVGLNNTVTLPSESGTVALTTDIPTPIVKNIKVTLTSAQLLNLFTTPIELVPAVTGKLLVPQFLFQKYNHVSTPYTTSGLFRVGLGTINFGIASFGAVITSADNAQGLNNFSYSQSASGLTYQNLPIVVGATTANPTGGNGTLDLYLTYLEVTL